MVGCCQCGGSRGSGGREDTCRKSGQICPDLVRNVWHDGKGMPTSA